MRRVVGEVLARHAEPADEPRPGTLRPRHPTTVTVGPAVVDLTPAKRALNRREFDHASDLLEEALDLVPDSAEALTLMGVLRESCGEDHAAYHFYKAALKTAPKYGPAQNNMRRYCARAGLDYCNKTINPGAR
jgi:Tfp pilus assembly protein PilF